MTTPSTLLLGISNAIVDVLAHVTDDFIDGIDAVPGSMTLIDEKRAQTI
ncbi:MAG: adenosine kinase, partial [Proteobacteria bacterium]|nr:adenosine kinase [Pseudomonadota bacterium]